jgi:hypothetical protein
LKKSIARSLRNDEVRAYMLHGNGAPSQATVVSKTSPVNPIFIRQACGVEGRKFSPLHPKAKTGRMSKGQEKGHGEKPKKIRNPEWRTNARLCFASLAGGWKLNILDFIGRLISFSPIAILCKVRHRPEGQLVKISPASYPDRN